MSATAGGPPRGYQDATCTLVTKLSSATRVSSAAGQPKPVSASLQAQVPGTTVRRPPGTDAPSSCVATAPPSPPLPKLSSSASNLPSGLNAPLAAELPAGSAIWVVRPVARATTCTRHRPAHPEVQAIRLALAASTAPNRRIIRVVAGSQSLYTGAAPSGTACASSSPRSVAWSITKPAGGGSPGPRGLALRATPRADPDTRAAPTLEATRAGR